MSQGSASLLQEAALLSVRIFTVDHYMAPPIQDVDATFSDFRSHAVRRVPVLRIFGPTPAGQKTCLHLHGIFPYIYVPVPESCPQGYAIRLAGSLDRALNLSMNQAETTQHVFKIQEVSGTPFYGYHPRQHRYFKIYFYNPMVVKKAADLLQTGGVMGAKLQPHEAHVPFTLQFMMDYNLQGMNFIHLAGVKFREDVVEDEDRMAQLRQSDAADLTLSEGRQGSPLDLSNLRAASERRFKVDDLPEGMLMPRSVERVSTTELEVDGVAADILNSNEAAGEELTGMNPGLQALWEDERERRRTAGLEDEALTPPASPPRPAEALEPTQSEKFWKERLLERLNEAVTDRPELFRVDSTRSSDPDATCNLGSAPAPEGVSIEGEKELVYPAETPESASLPSATEVSTHVSALSTTLPCAGRKSRSSSLRASRSRSTESAEASSASAAASMLSDDTIVDEEVVLSQSILQGVDEAVERNASLRLGGEEEEEEDLFGPGEEGQVEELASELQGQEAERGSGLAGSSALSSLLSARSREKEAEDDALSWEMSQLWTGVDEDENLFDDNEDECYRGLDAGLPASKDPAWDSDDQDDDEFWNDVIKNNL